jgi:hypothetical protein
VIHGEIAQRLGRHLGEASERRRERHTGLDRFLDERETEREKVQRGLF